MGKEVIRRFTSRVLTIPEEVRETLGIIEGSHMTLRVEDGDLIARPMARVPTDQERAFAEIERLRGVFAGPRSLSDELTKMRADDEACERRKWNL